MPLTYQILSLHTISKGKTKLQQQQKSSTTPKQNHQLILYAVKQKADIRYAAKPRASMSSVGSFSSNEK